MAHDSDIRASMHSGPPVAGRPRVDPVIEFYEEATDDYLHWSRGHNMHLGFYRRASGPFDREAMLEQMNVEIACRLNIDRVNDQILVDLGCGTGAISRTIARMYPRAVIKGVTISPSQVRFANRLNEQQGLQDRIEIFEGDYTVLPFSNRLVDAVWAVESACYADGSDKQDLIREMARVLKPGGRFVVADCFLTEPERDLNFLVKRCYSTVCNSWALTEMPVLDRFVAALGKHGFCDIKVEDISWRVVPSLVHAPFAVASFLLKRILSGESFGPHSINNLKASLLAPILGMNRSKFGYGLISGTLGV